MPPPGYPPVGWWRNGETDNLPDVKPWVEPNATFPGMLRDPEHAPLRRGYYASVSLMDAQIGKASVALPSLSPCFNTDSFPFIIPRPGRCWTPSKRRACATRRG